MSAADERQGVERDVWLCDTCSHPIDGHPSPRCRRRAWMRMWWSRVTTTGLDR
jgi:hypothetical protein